MARYIAKYKDGKHAGKWIAVGSQFAVPYVFKKLFSKEEITFEDMCETKSVTTALYLDMNEGLGENEHSYCFIGKVARFCPIKEGCGGGVLLREKDGKYYAATGTKGYRWLESEMVRELGKEAEIDRAYYDKMVDEAVRTIAKYGDFERFVSDDFLWHLKYLPPCENKKYNTCLDCPDFLGDMFHMHCNLGYEISDIECLKIQQTVKEN
ncbi:MAG: hypothetical protein LBC19_09095 [Tannerella sp.]|nr:hypothetical protein [Tannerella sp.]